MEITQVQNHDSLVCDYSVPECKDKVAGVESKINSRPPNHFLSDGTFQTNGQNDQTKPAAAKTILATLRKNNHNKITVPRKKKSPCPASH